MRYRDNMNGGNERSETMRKRILAVTAATSLALGTLAGSALAHHNTAAGKSVGVPAHATPSGLGHVGMECGAAINPFTPLEALGLPCPALPALP
jgi:hypothetical protein